MDGRGVSFITGSRGVSLIRGWLKPGARHSLHTHDVEEAVVFLSGSGLLEVGGRQQSVGPGDAVHIPAHVQHSTLNTGDEDLCFVAAFSGNVITHTAVGAAGNRAPVRLPTLRNRIGWLLRRVADRIGGG